MSDSDPMSAEPKDDMMDTKAKMDGLDPESGSDSETDPYTWKQFPGSEADAAADPTAGPWSQTGTDTETQAEAEAAAQAQAEAEAQAQAAAQAQAEAWAEAEAAAEAAAAAGYYY